MFKSSFVRLGLVILSTSSICDALKFTVSASSSNGILIPGGEIHIISTPESGDPAQVNVYLYNTVQKNRTELWIGLEPANSIHSIFDLPMVPPGPHYVVRATRSNDQFLTDSPEFEIFAVGSGSGKPTSDGTLSSAPTSTRFPTVTTTSPSQTNTPANANAVTRTSDPQTSQTSATDSVSNNASSTTSQATTIPSHQTVTPSNIDGSSDMDQNTLSTSKKPPIGAIIGGVIGGLVMIAIIFALLLYCRRRPHQDTASGPLRSKSLWSRSRNKNILPFTGTQPSSAATLLNPKRPIPAPHTGPVSTAAGFVETVMSNSGATISHVASETKYSMVDMELPPNDYERQLRRINAEMASLQDGTPFRSTSHHEHTRSEDSDLRQQLDDLRAQIRQLELRQAGAWASENALFDPPPVYNR